MVPQQTPCIILNMNCNMVTFDINIGFCTPCYRIYALHIRKMEFIKNSLAELFQWFSFSWLYISVYIAKIILDYDFVSVVGRLLLFLFFFCVCYRIHLIVFKWMPIVSCWTEWKWFKIFFFCTVWRLHVNSVNVWYFKSIFSICAHSTHMKLLLLFPIQL